jgi:hypothetical protein
MAVTQAGHRVAQSDSQALRTRGRPDLYEGNVRVVAYGKVHAFDSARRATVCGVPLAEVHRWEFPWEGRSNVQHWCRACVEITSRVGSTGAR